MRLREPPVPARPPKQIATASHRGAQSHGLSQAARIAGHLAALNRPSREAAPAPRRNDTGLPDRLKAAVENLSGLSMDDVRVHHGSSQPARLGAFAYARGSEIHLSPGQERHLPHEAWHVVQQKQGRVRATMQMKGLAINEDPDLEEEADAMGERAVRGAAVAESALAQAVSSGDDVHQLARTHREQRRAVRNQYGPRSRYGRPHRTAVQLPLAVMDLGNALNVAYRAAGEQPGGARHFVYLATQRGRVMYVGITNDVAARQSEHGDRFHLHQLNRTRLNRVQVRAIEQFGINRFRRDPNNQNIANSIAVGQPYYRAALAYGEAFFVWATEHMRHFNI